MDCGLSGRSKHHFFCVWLAALSGLVVAVERIVVAVLLQLVADGDDVPRFSQP